MIPASLAIKKRASEEARFKLQTSNRAQHTAQCPLVIALRGLKELLCKVGGGNGDEHADHPLEQSGFMVEI